MIARKFVLAAAACLALAGCGKKGDQKADNRAAAGEVLGGTISDAMLPLGTVTSTSPPDVHADEGTTAPAAVKADTATAQTPAPDATAAPEATAQPTTPPTAAQP